MSFKNLGNNAKQQGSLKKVTIIARIIPAVFHAKRDEEVNKLINDLNVIEIVSERTADTKKYKPK